jgi:uncharacterized protein YndB with AHSA1/START domain
MSVDRIEKEVLLHAPRERVWRAIADSAEFGTWFGMRFEGPFQPGAAMRATVVGTAVDAQVAEAQRAHGAAPFEIVIDRIEPQRLFSFRWHPYAMKPGEDYSSEPTTLIAFELAEEPEGVRLTVSESGFDRLPEARRTEAYAANEQGWAIVVTLISKYLAQST